MKKRSVSNDRPTVDKTINIPLPESRLKLRVVLVIALIAVAALSLAIGVNSLVGAEARDSGDNRPERRNERR